MTTAEAHRREADHQVEAHREAALHHQAVQRREAPQGPGREQLQVVVLLAEGLQAAVPQLVEVLRRAVRQQPDLLPR